jgi:RNA polymerase sigma factor (sigma-70 family)
MEESLLETSERRPTEVSNPMDEDLGRYEQAVARVGQAHDATDRGAVAFLVLSAAEGDHKAWDALVDRFASSVWAIARGHRLSSADAADVFQATWLRLLDNLHRIDHPEQVGAWLAATACAECLRMLRLTSRRSDGDDLEVVPVPGPETVVGQNLTAADRRKLVNRLVEQLPMRSQCLLRLLSADSPLSYREISEALSMPVGSIGPTRARALQQLRRIAVSAGLSPEDVFFA